jgi:hypothetical protein
MLLGLFALVRAAEQLSETEVAVGDEGAPGPQIPRDLATESQRRARQSCYVPAAKRNPDKKRSRCSGLRNGG